MVQGHSSRVFYRIAHLGRLHSVSNLRSTLHSEDFVQWYESEYLRQLRRAALILADREAAHDVVHDAFLECARRWNDLEVPSAYMTRSVVNRCRSRVRSESRRVAIIADASRTAENRWIDHEDVALSIALSELAIPDRALLVLKYYDQLKNREIAEILDWPLGSVGPRCSIALKTIRRLLDE